MTQTRQIRQYNQSGEKFVCDPQEMVKSDCIHCDDAIADVIDDFNLDLPMDQEDIDNSHQVGQ